MAAKYTFCDAPGKVLKDGEPVVAHEECDDLQDEILELRDEIEGLERQLTKAGEGIEISEVSRCMDRIRYAPSEKAERDAMKALMALFYPGTENVRRLFE